MIDCILNVDNYDDLINAVECVLEDIASQVVNVRMMIRNKCPWALYVSKATGRRWATFIARSKFKGYHFKFAMNCVICTDLETGKQYKVSLDFCSCETFRQSAPDEWGKKTLCKHIKLLQELGNELIWTEAISSGIATHAQASNVTETNPSDRPKFWREEWAAPTLINRYG